MAEVKPSETQRELFQEFSSEPKKPDRLPGISKTHKPILFHTSVEQLILCGIFFIVFCCLIFFLGVLRGKSLAKHAKTGIGPVFVQPTASLPFPPAPGSGPSAVQRLPSGALKKPGWSTKFPALPSVDPAKPYTIQLVTYKKKELAEKEIAALRRNKYYGFLIPSGDYFQVCVGQYANIDEAKKDLKFFSTRYKDRFLRRR